jgi:hypothetical protein
MFLLVRMLLLWLLLLEAFREIRERGEGITAHNPTLEFWSYSGGFQYWYRWRGNVLN